MFETEAKICSAKTPYFLKNDSFSQDLTSSRERFKDSDLSGYQVIWRLGAQSITVQTFPGPTSKFEVIRSVNV